ncbi:unnamed protein product [Dicrocoelium dendriticum]|nr:unnamed protein product [Dicrocoelium dendriticum]
MEFADKHHKILITGDVNGRLEALFSRVKKVTKSGAFDMMFCIGNFFGNDASDVDKIIRGDLEGSFSQFSSLLVPIPTYIVTPIDAHFRRYSDEKGSEVSHNLIFLGSQGVYTTVSGLRVVYISSCEEHPDDPNDLSNSVSPHSLVAEDVGFLGVDILLTIQWPSGVNNFLTYTLPQECTPCVLTSSKAISKLAYFLRPRYHFASGKGFYFERSPYRNHRVLQEKANHVTRFISLANVKNPQNHKYMYALKLLPIDKMDLVDLNCQPPDTTENPYRDIAESKCTLPGKETEVQTEQYFYDQELTHTTCDRAPRKRHFEGNRDTSFEEASTFIDGAPGRKRTTETLEEKLEKPREQAACWFCLGNPEVKKHLIVSVNTQAYLALPRGPLVTDHVLILTVGHHRSWTACPDYVRVEIEDYKERLKRMFANDGKAMVAYERNLKTQHYQLQVVPIPFAVAGEVKHAFLDLSTRCETSPCVLQPIPRNAELNEICAPGIPYFHVELPTGERLFGQIKRDRIPTSDIHFGRFVLSNQRILNCPDRADWRNCVDSVERETQLTLKMRERFAPYDIE